MASYIFTYVLYKLKKKCPPKAWHIMWHPITMSIAFSMQLNTCFSSIVLDGHKLSCTKVVTFAIAFVTTFTIHLCPNT